MFRHYSISTKLAIAVASLASLMAIFVAAFVLIIEYRGAVSELHGDSVTMATMLQRVLPLPLRLGDDFEVFQLLSAPFQGNPSTKDAKGLGGRSLQHVLLLDDEGRVLSSSHPKVLPLNQLHSYQEPEFLPYLGELSKLRLDREPLLLEHDEIGGFYVIGAVGEGGVKYANLLLDYSARPLREVFLKQGALVICVVLLGGMLLTVLGMRWSMILTTPLSRLNLAVLNVAKRYGFEFEDKDTSDELRLLYHSFRQLDQALTSSEDSRTQIAKREQLAFAGLEHSTQGIFITDRSGNIQYVNSAFEQSTGYHRDEVIGRNPRVLKSGKTAPGTYDAMWAALLASRPWQGELINRRRDGSEYVERVIISPVSLDGKEVTHYLAVQEDISERIAAQAQIRHQAEHDALTGLPNRVLFNDRLEQAIKSASRDGELLALMFLDLDHFKQVNDLLGHHAGDELLKMVSKRLVGLLRSTDTVCRFGGDEFVLLLNPVQGPDEALAVANKVLQKVLVPYQVDGKKIRTTISIGVAIYPLHGMCSEELGRNADIAMYHAKGLGRNRCQIFEPAMHVKLQERVTIEEEIGIALLERQFILHYQPQFDANTGLVCGIESLIRWQHPQRGLVFPVDFIERAEDSGQIVQIGAWVIDETCRQMRAWIDEGLQVPSMAVNVSFQQFHGQDLVEIVDEALSRHRLSGDMLEIELTESVMLREPEIVYAVLQKLRDRGVKLSIDDFGTGYSSLQYLRKLKVDTLKIDRAFVMDITSSQGRAMVETIVGIAASLSLKTIAEGVETDAQLSLLRNTRCDTLQGYLFSKPLPPDQLAEKLTCSYCPVEYHTADSYQI